MRTLMRRSGALLILAAFAVSTTAPAIAQSGSPSGVTQRLSILTELSATGVPGSSRVFTQLTVAGNGPVSVTLPGQATRGLRNLDGYRRPDVDGDDVTWQLDATPDGTSVRSVADNTADLPVSVEVAYHLDGQEVGPRDLAGRTGELEVAYTITNLTAEPRDLVAFDAQNQRSTTTEDIAVPMVGSLAVTLPPTFTGIEAPGANVAGDGRGSTVVNFSLLLFSPLGSESQTVTYAAHVSDAVVPSVTVQVLPVDDRSFTSLRSTEEAYKGAVESTLTLANGALILDSNVQLLASGAAQLLDGLEQLADGAQQLSTGLADTAAPGARELADGTGRARSGAGELSTGLGELSLGANRLSGGLGDARSGGGQLSSGLVDLADGASRIDAGAGALSAGATQLDAGATQLSDGAGLVAGGTVGLRDGLRGLHAGLLEPGGLIDAVRGGIAQIRTLAVAPLRAGVGDVGQIGTLVDGLDRLSTGLAEAKDGTQAVSLLNGQLYGGFLASRPGLAAAVGATTDTGRGSACIATSNCTLADVYQVLLEDPTVVATYGPLLMGAAAGMGAVNAGLGDSLASLGDEPANCAEAVTAVTLFAQGMGPEPSGLQSLLAASCIADQLDEGIRTGVGGQPGAADGAALLLAGAKNVRDGLAQLDGALVGFDGSVVTGGETLAQAFGSEDVEGQTLLNGIARLVDGSEQVATGASKLQKDGTSALAAGAGQLSDGAGQLAAGADRAADGAKALRGGLGQLDDGGKQLAAGADRAATGGRDLASGLGLIDDGANRLADGLGDAADGSTKLAEGLSSAEEGGGKIADGTVRLSEVGMGSLISGVSDATEAASLSRARVRAVTDRGRQYAAPYGVAAGADASAVWKFEIAGVGSPDGGPSTGLLVGLALLALLAAGGLSVVLRRRLG